MNNTLAHVCLRCGAVYESHFNLQEHENYIHNIQPETTAPIEGRKDDADKPRFDLLPSKAERLIVDVLTYGAKKYAPENWRKVENSRARYYRAARGHLWSWWTGEKNDPGSGHPHLAHAACCILFLLEIDE